MTEFDGYTSTQLRKTYQLLLRLMSKRLHPYQVGQAYMPYLMHLWHRDGQKQRELYQAVGVEQPTALRTLERMERDGWVTKSPCPTDRRATLIHLTPLAREFESSLRDTVEGINTEALRSFSEDEVREFRRLLKKMSQSIETSLA